MFMARIPEVKDEGTGASLKLLRPWNLVVVVANGSGLRGCNLPVPDLI